MCNVPLVFQFPLFIVLSFIFICFLTVCVLAFVLDDHSRVHLSSLEGVPDSDFINASFINVCISAAFFQSNVCALNTTGCETATSLLTFLFCRVTKKRINL